jgi:hypothetical protein
MSNETGSDGLDEIDTLLLDKKFRSTYKGQGLKCAKQLGYSSDVRNRIKNATSDIEIEHIMYQAAKDTRDQRDRELGRM